MTKKATKLVIKDIVKGMKKQIYKKTIDPPIIRMKDMSQDAIEIGAHNASEYLSRGNNDSRN